MTFPDEELLIDSRSLFILTILESPVTLRVVVPTPIISNSYVKDSFIPYDLPSVNSYLITPLLLPLVGLIIVLS